jgi:hypothetical protein
VLVATLERHDGPGHGDRDWIDAKAGVDGTPATILADDPPVSSVVRDLAAGRRHCRAAAAGATEVLEDARAMVDSGRRQSLGADESDRRQLERRHAK